MSAARAIRDGLRAGLLLTVTGVLAVVTGQPLVFPSLGPTAYVLARTPTAGTARRVVGGHTIGVVAGVLTYRLVAPDLVLTGALPPLGDTSLRLATAAVLSVALTTAGMVATDAEHAPACATTLICALGLLTTPLETGGILVSVLVVLGSDRLLVRLE